MNRQKHKQSHTHAPRGKRIAVILKNGTRFEDKFIERRAHDVVFESRTVAAADIQSFTIWRPITRENKPSRQAAEIERQLKQKLGKRYTPEVLQKVLEALQ